MVLINGRLIKRERSSNARNTLLHRGFEFLESSRSLMPQSFPEGRLGSVLSVAVVSADNRLDVEARRFRFQRILARFAFRD